MADLDDLKKDLNALGGKLRETEKEIQKQELQIKINEAKEYLNKTDHKFYNGYKPKEGEDLVEIERLRDEAREFIRANEGDE